MGFRCIVRSLVPVVIITSFAVYAGTLEAPGTWWGLVMNGLVAAGFVEEDDQIDYLNEIFGTSFDTLEELKAYNLQLVEDTWDENQNGYVCAFQLRGTRAHFHNPYVDLTFFGITDDTVA